jgi:DNA invertase Pin-like site-specific DNA recombinase/peptidoglycan hydrolase-like protein with peptidoglycan-binding domain
MGPRTKAAAAAAVFVAAAAAAVLAAPASAASHQSKSVLAQGIGMRSHPSTRVRTLQRALVRHGYSVGPSGVDGRFGPRTRLAVRRLQRHHHIKVDGIAGPQTRRALRLGARGNTAARRSTRTSSHRTTSSRRQSAPAARTTTPTAVVVPSAPVAPAKVPSAPVAPAKVPLSTTKSGSDVLIIGPLAALIAAIFAFAYIRQRRRYAARIAAYHLRAGEPPSPEEDATSDEPRGERVAERVPAAVAAQRRAGSTGLPPGAPVIGYVAEGPASSRDRRMPDREIERACERSGWQVVDVVRDDEDGRILERRNLSRALERIAKGDARALVVNDARLLSRSVDFATFVQWFRDADAALIALDLGLDTSTPEGSRVASALITLNGWAGEWIASRTRRSLADIRPKTGDGPRLAISERPEILDRIARMRDDRMSLQEIAEQLNLENVPTLFGTEKWWPSTVKAGLRYWRAASQTRMDQLPATERKSASA